MEPWEVPVNRTRQDDKVENKQLELFEMIPGPGRSNKYVPDGTLIVDEQEYRGELKSTSVTRGHFSTSSRMGIMKVEAWRKGFDFSVFSTVGENGTFVEHYVLFQQDLEPFYMKVIDKQNKGHAGRAGMNSWNRACQQLREIGWDSEELDKLTKQNLFGSRINDPGVSISDVKEWGIRLDSERPAEHLRQLIKEHNG